MVSASALLRAGSQQVTDDEGTVADRLNGFVGRSFGIGQIVTYSTKIGKSHLDFNARWIHDFCFVYAGYTPPLAATKVK